MRGERILCIGFIYLRLWLFGQFLGHGIGHDIYSQLEMQSKVGWDMSLPPLTEGFFSYHPPLGFFLPKLVAVVGLSYIQSIQVISFISSVGAFLFLRATLAYLGFLRNPAAIIFLYLSSAIPLQIFLSRSINLDVQILFYTSAALYVSCRLFWNKKNENEKPRWFWWVLLINLLWAALLTKFSGVLILGIPFLVYGFSPSQQKKSITYALSAGLLAILLVLPFYYVRYFQETGTFLPGNEEWAIPQELASARKERDQNKIAFVVRSILGPWAPASMKQNTSLHTPYIWHTWLELWLKNPNMEKSSAYTLALGQMYERWGWWMGVVGLLIFMYQSLMAKRDSTWLRFGGILLGLSLIQVGAMLAYIFAYPVWEWSPEKAIYIAPVTWGVGYFITFCFTSSRLQLLASSGVVVTIVYMILNHLIPVY